jgi:hypothetical protein
MADAEVGDDCSGEDPTAASDGSDAVS